MTNESKKIVIGPVDLLISWAEDDRNLLFLQTGYKYSESDHDAEKVLEFLITRAISIFSTLRKVLENLPTGATIIDIGAGNSLIDLLIHATYPEKKFKFVLVDGEDTYNSSEPGTTGNTEYHSPSYTTYNNWSFLKNTILLNNMDESQFITKSPDDDWSDTPVDLAMSLSSWCWHYPASTYIDKVNSLLKLGGYVYINEMININDGYQLLSSTFNKDVECSFRQWKPSFDVESSKVFIESDRKLNLIKTYGINPAKFSGIFIGRK